MQKLFAAIFILINLLSYSGNAVSSQGNKQKPNVIVILSDDQGYGDFSVNGNPILRTPNLDQLATDGIQLTDFHVDPTCSPSRAGLMTGRFSTRAGVWLTFAGRNHLYREETTMADVFKHNHYRTAIFGKWHLGDNYPFRPQDRGFDQSFIHGGGVAGETPDYWDNDYFDDTYFKNGQPVKTKGYTTDVWFNQAKQFISESKEGSQDTPFFIYLAANAPHGPFNVEEKYFKPYLKYDIPETRARFYGMIETIDSNVGKLRKFLKQNKLDQNTLIVYMTDNGTSKGFEGVNDGYPKTQNSGFNALMRGRKTSAYEGGHRAASFWYWPQGGLTGNDSHSTLTAQIDILPTFVDMFDLALPKPIDFDGTSLKPILTKQAKQLPERKFVIHNQADFGKPIGEGSLVKNKDFVVLQDKWRLVGKELYNLKTDPSQRHNIRDQHPQKAMELANFYETWWQDVTKHQRFSPTVINTNFQQETTLTSQAWFGDVATYDQSHVRAGKRYRGLWMIDVETPGTYSIEFSRWPKESDLALNDKYVKDFSPKKLDQNFALYKLPSQAFKVNAVELILDQEKIKTPVTGREKTVQFKQYLSKGRHKIEGLLHTEGKSLSAYYMYLKPAY